MKKFNEEIASARPVPEERADFGKRGVVERAAFRASLASAAAGSKISDFSVHRGPGP
jgi:hypothetical protein